MKKNKGLFSLLTGILFLCSFLVPYLSVQADELSGEFAVEASAAIAIDVETGKVFYDQNSETPLGIASITKLISLYVVEKEIAEGRLSWEDPVTISEHVAELSVHPELSNVPLEANTTYTVKELFDSAVIQSANASTMALAEKISGTEVAFVDKMKQQLAEWGIVEPKIINSSGLTNKYLGDTIYPNTTSSDENELSAKDVAIVARHLINEFPAFLEISAVPTQDFATHTDSPVTMINSNWMLPGLPNEKEGVDGLKTGTTDFAGSCFVATIEKNGQRIITVVLDADNEEDEYGARFVQTGRLIDYTFENWQQQEILSPGDQLPTLTTAPVYLGTEFTVPLSAESAITTWMHSSMTAEDFTFEAVLNSVLLVEDALPAPLSKGAVVGTASLNTFAPLGYLETTDQERAQQPEQIQVNLITDQAVEEASTLVKAWRGFKTCSSNTWSIIKEGSRFIWNALSIFSIAAWHIVSNWFNGLFN